MHAGRTIFSQVMDWLPPHEFRRCVARYHGDYRVRHMSCLDQFYCMAFAQLTYRESLRDIEACLRGAPTKLYHLGLRTRVSRSTLADANEHRDARIYADLARTLMATAQRLYAGDERWRHLRRAVYALDSSLIELSLKLFPWAQYKPDTAGVKLHTLLNVSTHVPAFVRLTRGKVHDVRVLDELPVEPGAVYVVDRAYVDYARLFRITQHGAYFVARPRRNLRFRRTTSRPVDWERGVRVDQTVRLVSFYSARGYPDSLRRVCYVDVQRDKHLTFISNNFNWAALTIAELYKSRWQVELFFKWLKQHLRIQAFYGTSENAVKTQLWIALSVYLILAIAKKELRLPHSLHTISQILSVNLFEKTPLQQLLAQATCTETNGEQHNSLSLFAF
jgi:hypothetical protein